MERPDAPGAVAEALLRSIVSISTDAIISTDEEQRIWLFNGGAEQTFGYQADEVLGRPLSMLIPERFRASHGRHMANFAASGASARTMGERMEVHGIRSNGEEFPAEAAISKTWLGGRRYFTVVLRDITARKQAEDVLRRSEERFRQLAESVREVFWIREASSGAVDYVSPAYDEVFGRSRERLYDDPGSFLDLVHPADVATVLSTWENVTSDRPPGVFRIIREGEVRWLESRAFPVRDARGTVVRYVGVAADITDRHRREELRSFLADAGIVLASSLEVKTTLEHVARLAAERLADWCIIYVLDGEDFHLEVASAEPASGQVAAWVRRFLADSPVPSVIRDVIEQGRPRLLPAAERAAGPADGVGDPFESVIEAVAASSAMVIPLTAKDRTRGAIVLISSEVGTTYAEDDMALATELAGRAGLAIDNALLFTAAQDAIRARDEVVGTVAHDLGNPLSVIAIVCRSLLNKGPDAFDDDTFSLLQGTYESSVRMGRLIEDLLDISRLDAVGLQVHLETMKVGPFVHDVADKVRPLAENKKISLHVDVPSELPAVSADADRLSQVMWNLLGNAIKFTQENGSVSIAVQAADGEVRFSVIDNGPGIPAETQRTLFDRFAKGPDKRRGVGLGLAISKGIVEAHGGRIWIESQVGQGCAMRFTLPASG